VAMITTHLFRDSPRPGAWQGRQTDADWRL